MIDTMTDVEATMSLAAANKTTVGQDLTKSILLGIHILHNNPMEAIQGNNELWMSSCLRLFWVQIQR